MDTEDAIDRIGTGTVVIGAGFIIGAVLEYGVKVVLARYLGPDVYGVFIQGLAVTEIVAVVALIGLHRGLPRVISYYVGEGDTETVENAVWTAGIITIIGGTVSAALLYLVGPIVATTVFKEPMLVGVMQLFAVALLPLSFFYLVIGIIRGLQNARYKMYLTDVFLPTVQILLLLGLFHLGFGVDGAVYAYMAAVSLTVVGGIYYVRRLSDYRLRGRDFIPRKLILFSWPLMVVSIILGINKWIDVLMLGWLTTSATVGVYEVALAVAGLSTIFLNSLNYMYMPVVSELYGAEGGNLVARTYRIASRWVYTLALPVFAGFLIFPHDILLLLFGSNYTGGAAALVILAAGFFLSTAVGPAGTTLIAVGRTKQFMAAMLLLGVADIVLNLVLIPPYGMVGAATAMTTGFVLANIAMVWFVHRETGTQPVTRRYVTPLVAAIVTALPTYAIARTMSLPVYGSVVLGGVMVAAYLALTAVLGGVHEEDREMLQRLLGRATSRT